MKAVNWFFVILFTLSAGLQYNDPDPYIWIPLYLYGAYICFQSIRGKYQRLTYIIGFITYTVYAVFLFFDTTGVWSWYHEHDAENIAQSMKATKPWIEETREFFGLLLLLIALLINWLWWRSKRLAGLLPDPGR
jgi:Ca2+/H+ antiporter